MINFGLLLNKKKSESDERVDALVSEAFNIALNENHYEEIVTNRVYDLASRIFRNTRNRSGLLEGEDIRSQAKDAIVDATTFNEEWLKAYIKAGTANDETSD